MAGFTFWVTIGQNFYHDCKRQFCHGNTHPHLLGRELCGSKFGEDRKLEEVRFYSGIHSSSTNPKKNAEMARRLAVMHSNNIWTFSRQLKYSRQWVKNNFVNNDDDPEFIEIKKPREKGVDVRIALDLVMLAITNKYDIATLVSTDTDLEEAIREVLLLRSDLKRWITVENAICVPEVDPVIGRRPPFKRLHKAPRYLPIDQEIFDRIRDDVNYNL